MRISNLSRGSFSVVFFWSLFLREEATIWLLFTHVHYGKKQKKNQNSKLGVPGDIRRKSLSRTIFKFFARSLLLKEAKFHHFSKKKSLERFLSFNHKWQKILKVR